MPLLEEITVFHMINCISLAVEGYLREAVWGFLCNSIPLALVFRR
jgi:hypothetical protein